MSEAEAGRQCALCGKHRPVHVQFWIRKDQPIRSLCGECRASGYRLDDDGTVRRGSRLDEPAPRRAKAQV
jgi:hypothetical protein